MRDAEDKKKLTAEDTEDTQMKDEEARDRLTTEDSEGTEMTDAEEEDSPTAEDAENTEGAETRQIERKEKRPPPQERRCQRGAGSEQQCRAARMRGSEFCFFHDPVIRGHRLQLRELDELPLGRSRDLHRLLARVVKAVENEELNPQQAYAIGWLVQLLLQTLHGVEAERSLHSARSYGQLVSDAFARLRRKDAAESEEEYGPDEAEETEWDPPE
jgi:hypothetical protein